MPWDLCRPGKTTMSVQGKLGGVTQGPIDLSGYAYLCFLIHHKSFKTVRRIALSDWVASFIIHVSELLFVFFSFFLVQSKWKPWDLLKYCTVNFFLRVGLRDLQSDYLMFSRVPRTSNTQRIISHNQEHIFNHPINCSFRPPYLITARLFSYIHDLHSETLHKKSLVHDCKKMKCIKPLESRGLIH